MRRVVLAASLVAAGAIIAIACGDDEAATPPPDGSTVDASEDTTTIDPGDANDGSTPIDPGCRTAAAPSAKCGASPTACERKTLYISSSSTFPFAIVTDDANVYWVAQSGPADAAYDGTAIGSVYRVAKNGDATQAATVLAKDQSRVTTLVRDGVDLYWIASEANDAGSTSTLRRVTNVAGTPGAVEDLATFGGIARRLVRVGPGVFFTADSMGAVRRLAKDATKPAFEVSDIEKTSTTPSLAASKDLVFASGGQVERVDSLPKAGGPPSTFLTVPEAGPDAALPGVHVLGADCDRVFGIRDDQSSFFWSNVANAQYTGTTSTFDDAQDILSDEGFVYVARRKGGGVERGGRDGKGFASLYTGDVWRLAVDDDGIYWGEHGNPKTGGSLAGNVFMQTKK